MLKFPMVAQLKTCTYLLHGDSAKEYRCGGTVIPTLVCQMCRTLDKQLKEHMMVLTSGNVTQLAVVVHAYGPGVTHH